MALPRFQKFWLGPAWIALGIARLAVLLVPFRHLGRFVGVAAGVYAWIPLATEAQCRRAEAIGQVVRRAAGYTPFDANCLAQALAARALLGLYHIPYALFFGVAHDQLAAGSRYTSGFALNYSLQVRTDLGGGLEPHSMAGGAAQENTLTEQDVVLSRGGKCRGVGDDQCQSDH